MAAGSLKICIAISSDRVYIEKCHLRESRADRGPSALLSEDPRRRARTGVHRFRMISPKNHDRRSASSIHVSIKLAVATSLCRRPRGLNAKTVLGTGCRHAVPSTCLAERQFPHHCLEFSAAARYRRWNEVRLSQSFVTARRSRPSLRKAGLRAHQAADDSPESDVQSYAHENILGSANRNFKRRHSSLSNCQRQREGKSSSTVWIRIRRAPLRR